MKRISRRSAVLAQKAADYLYSVHGKNAWALPPPYVFRSLSAHLGMEAAGHVERGDRLMARLVCRDGTVFLGPVEQSGWCCPPSTIRFIRGLPGLAQLEAEHIALIYNVVARYAVELSAYPFRGIRTTSLRAGDVFLDIGAFRGYVSLKASRIVGDKGLVIAVEPIAENMAYVTEHGRENECSALCAIEGAVTNSTEEIISFFRGKNQANSYIAAHLEHDVETTTVSNITIDEIVSQINSHHSERVIASITTNGTEMGLAISLFERLRESKKYFEITIPILYTSSGVSALAAEIASRGGAVIVEHPWMKLIYAQGWHS